MQRLRWFSVVSLVVSLAVTPAFVGGATAGAVAPGEQVVVTTAARTPDNYTPRTGVKFNNPLDRSRRRVLQHINRTINSVPKKEKIRILSWNIRSDAFVDALIAAHRRGVSVRVLISLGNANPDNPNQSFNRLQRVLREGNKKRPKTLRSFARKCDRSCRGERGIAHTKMYLFSRAGKARNVVMYSSANATEVAVTRQWNDVYTLANRAKPYGDFIDMFNEMKKDKPAKPPYRKFVGSRFTSEFLPWKGKKAKGDPTLNVLNKVRCNGATRGTGVNGRTHIRIAQTAILNKRGIRIADRLKEMWDNGCNIKIVYALMGNNVLRAVRRPGGRGPVPIRQIAQDWEDDGVYDRYLHLKYMTISGVYAGDRSTRLTVNGTANWSGLTMVSDEIIGYVPGERMRRKHADWVDHLFGNPPPQRLSGRLSSSTIAPDGLPRQGANPLPVSVKHGGIEF